MLYKAGADIRSLYPVRTGLQKSLRLGSNPSKNSLLKFIEFYKKNKKKNVMCLFSKCPMLQNTSTPRINWVHYEENAKICATHGNDQPCNPRYTVYTFQCSYATVIGDGLWPLYRHMTLYTLPLHTTGHNQTDHCVTTTGLYLRCG